MAYISLVDELAETEDDKALTLLPVGVKVYKRRWWILFIFASLGFMQCAVWNTWGPITNSVKAAYPSWDNSDIALLSMWGTITMLIGLFPFTFMLQTQGLRTSIIVTSGLLAVGSTVRLFATGERAFTILAHIGAILNGFAGIIIGCAPSLLSSIWFPPHERTTATGIGCTFNQLGNAGGFFLGPWIIKEISNHSNATHSTSGTDTEVLREAISDYMWITAGLCVPLFLFCLAYFPDKPKRPPSLTSAIDPTGNSFKEDLALILRNRNFWCIVVPYSLTIGVNVAWSSVLNINLISVGITQDEASWIGVYMTFGGVVLAIISARITDLLFGHVKLTIISLLIVSALMFTWFLFMMNGCLPFDKTQIFISTVMGSSFSYACSPLFFELAVEIAYPVSEGVTGCVISFFWNITAACFLALLQLKMQGVVWMDYLLSLQSITAIIFMMCFVKEEYKRTSLDKTENATVTVQEEDPIEEELFGDLFRSTTSFGGSLAFGSLRT